MVSDIKIPKRSSLTKYVKKPCSVLRFKRVLEKDHFKTLQNGAPIRALGLIFLTTPLQRRKTDELAKD